MRVRGAQATIVAVAADDGGRQTIEALQPRSGCVRPDRGRGQQDRQGRRRPEQGARSAHRVRPGSRGVWRRQHVRRRLRQGLGIEDLLESIVLTADAALDLRATPDQDAQIVIEGRLTAAAVRLPPSCAARTLRVGDSVVTGDAYGRVRPRWDEDGYRSMRPRLPPGPGARSHLGARRRRQLRRPGGSSSGRSPSAARRASATRCSPELASGEMSISSAAVCDTARAEPHPQG